MYFVFIDESGTTDQKDKTLVYVYSALIMQEKGWNYLHKETQYLKQRVWKLVKNKTAGDEPPEDFQLHMLEITNRSGYYEALKDNDPLFLSICNMIYRTISTLFAKIINVIIIKDDFYKEYSEGLDKWAFELLVERINRYVISDNVKKTEFALLVMHSTGEKIDDIRRKQIEVFMERGTGHGWEEYPEQVIETPFIVKSKIHSGVQLIDAVSYLMRRYVRKCLGENPEAFFHKHCNQFMNLIKTQIYGYEGPHNYKDLIDNTIKFFPTSTKTPDNFWDIFK